MTSESPIRITPEAKQAVARQAERLGMNQKILASRVLAWFGRQDKEVQAFIVHHGSPSATLQASLKQ